MDNPKNELATRLKEANNVLVTVSTNPSVDQLAASIGLTLFLSKLKKHATTVFSGQVPSTIEFLKPEQTIESTTDSLRDFIISLDKAKADKIRYKVEDTMVKIFITPYRTSIGEPDLVFSQGDFNVDVVVGLGIHNKDDLDQAITAHGRILHDATVATINTSAGSDIGNLNWVDSQTSSLCEMMVAMTDLMKANSLDGQIATAFLTGIVAETERFSNEKTTSTTMNASAKLMAAGANQQLVASQLEDTEPSQTPPTAGKPPGHASPPQDGSSEGEDGALHIVHEEQLTPKEPPVPTPQPSQDNNDDQYEPILPAPMPMDVLQPMPQQEEPVHIKTEHREFLGDHMAGARGADFFSTPQNNGNMPPGQPGPGGQMSAASNPAMLDQDTPSLNLPQVSTPLLSHVSGNPSQSKAHNNPQNQSVPPEPVPPPAPLSPPQPIPEPLPTPPPVDPPVPPPPMPPPDVQSQPPAALPGMPAQMTPALAGLPPNEPPHQSKPAEPSLPKAVIDVMDDRTLKDIEKAVDSPHTKAVGKDLGGKTLDDIEKKVAPKHHEERQKAAAGSEEPTSSKLPLQYEAVPSEPPEKPKAAEAAPHPAQPQPAPAPPASPSSPQIVGHSNSPVQNDSHAQDDLDEDKIRARIDAALASSDSKPLPPRTDLNAGGALSVGHEEVKDDKEKESDLKPVHIDPTTGALQYLDDQTLPKDNTAASTNDPTAPPPVPPPMSFPQSPGAPGTSASPVVV